mgnify:CR=1 FL=1
MAPIESDLQRIAAIRDKAGLDPPPSASGAPTPTFGSAADQSSAAGQQAPHQATNQESSP